jgi:arylsulfatase A-like enzyme
VAAWFGLAAGLGEALSWAVRRHLLHQLTFLSRDQVWMAPLTDVVLFLALGLFLQLGSRLLPDRWRWPVSIFAFTCAATAAVLMVWPQIAPWAVWLLGAGVGTRMAQSSAAREAEVTAALRRTLLPLGALVLLVGLVGMTTRALAERRALAAFPSARPGAPNVLLLVWDTVRRQNVGAYGYHRPTTPTFDSLTRAGVRFDHAVAAAPWTLPSHSTIFTARWPHEHRADWLAPLDSRYPVLAQAFDSGGYRTGGFAGNRYYCGYEFGLARGFTHFVDYRVTPGEMFYSASLGRAISNMQWPRRITGYYNAMGHSTAADVNREFLRWLGGQSDRPFFGFLNYMDAHAPRVAPAPFDAMFGAPLARPLHRIVYSNHDAEMAGWPFFGTKLMQTEIDAYDGAIAYMDRETGALLAALRQRGLLENTIVIITADHGESFGERGVGGHGTSLYREAIEVPLLIIAPGRVPMGAIVNRPVSLRDLAQTALDLAGLRDPFGFPGVSLRRHLEGPVAEDTLLSELQPLPDRPQARFPKIGNGMASVVLGGWHYIRNGNGTEELYRFADDPAQPVDLIHDSIATTVLPSLRAALNATLR